MAPWRHGKVERTTVAWSSATCLWGCEMGEWVNTMVKPYRLIPWLNNDGQVICLLMIVDHWFSNFEWRFFFYRIQILYFLRRYRIPQILAQTLPQKALGSWNGWYKLSPANECEWLGSPNYVTQSPYNSYKGPWFFCSTPESPKFTSSNRIWSDSGWWILNIVYCPWYMGCHPSHWRTHICQDG